MLSARAYSFRQKSRLAISLSWVAGYTNVITFLLCGGVVVSHTTGNITHLGEGVGHGEWAATWYFAFLFVAFFLGAAASAWLTELARRRSARSKYIVPIAIEALLLGLLAIGLNTHVNDDLNWTRALSTGHVFTLYWMTGVASMAMGLQNATITRVSGAVIRTTHLTGVTTDLGIEIVQLLYWWYDKLSTRGANRLRRTLALSSRHAGAQRAALLASIIGSFLLGAVLGTWMYHWRTTLALLLPIAFLLFMIYKDWRTPIADVKELDLLADPELAAFGLVKSLLPPELGIYRLSHHRRDKAHEAPDFTAWAERLPRHWRVIVLALSPMTRLTTNSFIDLAAVVEKLHQQHRDLILCSPTANQYRAMAKSDLPNVLDSENICPDMEFAIARAIGLIESMKHTPANV